MLRFLILIVIVFSFSFSGHAQHHERSEESAMLFNAPLQPDDSLKRVLHEHGRFEGHFRTYFMGTLNHGYNPDYYALAAGAGLGYYSPILRNLQFGISGFMIYNVVASPLGPENGYINRYELALFDVTDPENRRDLDRLENLYLRYYVNSRRRSFVQAGKFHIETPLLNQQDSRMRPNLQEGVWAEFREGEKIGFRGGWLWSTSPRGTVEWYNIGESIGTYGMGKAPNGNPADYRGHIKSKRILIGNLEWQPTQNINYVFWNYHADNLFNMALQKIEVHKSFTKKSWRIGMQYLWQAGLGDGTLPVENQYINPDEKSHVLSARVAYTDDGEGSAWSLNYTRITRHGRFLFPREWGTETLYTFNNRERNEGAGDVHAVMVERRLHPDKDHRIVLRGRSGIYSMPAPEDARLNKYSLPSYYQLTLQGNYTFRGFLNGLQAQVLYSFKGNLHPKVELQPEVMHNKTDMHHFGVRMDYYF